MCLQKPCDLGQRVISFFNSVLNEQWTWEKDGNGNIASPSFQCGFQVRHDLFFTTVQRCKEYSDHWTQLHSKYEAWDPIGESLVHEVRTGLLKFTWVTHEGIRQTKLLQSCRSCATHSSQTCPVTILDLEGLELEEKSDDQSGIAQVQDFVLDCNRRPRSPESGSGDNLERRSQLSGPPQAPNSNPFDHTFDDYTSCPLPLQESRNTLGTYTFTIDGVALVPDAWSEWRDRGLRLPHNAFFRTIQTAEAIQGLESSLTFGHISYRKMHPHGLSNPDSCDFSAVQLLDEAGNRPGSRQSKRVLITGRAEQEDSRYLVLNLEKDGVNVPFQDISISVDLDSLIWVTTLSGFRAASMNVHLAPLIPHQTAISNNNFIYVTLLDSPQNQDQLHNPHIRTHQTIPLSRIPHLEFGFCGSGERRINLLVFFPRMIHKPQNARRYATLLPPCVQDLWYDQVVIPSCIAVLKNYPGLSEYLPPSLQEMRRQLNHRSRSIFLANPNNFMDEIQRRIQASGELLSSFGSLFLVADGRGMKFATKQCIASHTEQDTIGPSLEQIKTTFPELDWTRMLDRQFGELYLDVGISYHTNYNPSLTGLWRIPHLQKSFELLGSRSPTIHPLGTLGFYGGLKAEMKSKSKRDNHIASRISYCLAFETIRAPGTKEYLCSNKDIIERSQKFVAAVQNWSALFLSAQSRSFGVRDEIRGLGSLILNFLPKSIEKVFLSF